MENMKNPSKLRIRLSYYVIKPILKLFLLFLFKVTRKKSTPLYPYDKETKTITLPKDIKKEIYHLLKAEKKVANLTGAGLKVSKDYVDAFETKTKK